MMDPGDGGGGLPLTSCVPIAFLIDLHELRSLRAEFTFSSVRGSTAWAARASARDAARGGSKKVTNLQ